LRVLTDKGAGRRRRHTSRLRLDAGRLEGEKLLEEVECVLVDVQPQRRQLGTHTHLFAWRLAQLRTDVVHLDTQHARLVVAPKGAVLGQHLGEKGAPRRRRNVVEDLQRARIDREPRRSRRSTPKGVELGLDASQLNVDHRLVRALQLAPAARGGAVHWRSDARATRQWLPRAGVGSRLRLLAELVVHDLHGGADIQLALCRGQRDVDRVEERARDGLDAVVGRLAFVQQLLDLLQPASHPPGLGLDGLPRCIPVVASE
jgi:hypothetical protein